MKSLYFLYEKYGHEKIIKASEEEFFPNIIF